MVGGGLIRDHHGSLLQAFCTSVEARSSYEAELWALLHGLNLVVTFLSHIWVEMYVVAVTALLVSSKHDSADI